MKNYKLIARLFGVFFILAFLSYGIGSGIIDSIISTGNALENIQDSTTSIVIAVILMFFVHSIVNIGLPVLMVPVLKPYNRILAYGYLSFGIAATVIVVVRSIFSMLLIPLGELYAASGSQPHLESLAALLIAGGNISYQMSMALWGIGGLALTSLLYISRIIPRGISVWGFIGYLIFMTGTILELFAYPVGVMLSLPGGLFELFLSGWFIIKGFNMKEDK